MENNKIWVRIGAGIFALSGLGVYLVLTPKSPYYIQHYLFQTISYVLIFIFLAISAFANKPKLNIVTSITMIFYSVMWLNHDIHGGNALNYFRRHIHSWPYIFTKFKSWCALEIDFVISISFLFIGLFILIAILSNSKKNILYSILPMLFLVFDTIISLVGYSPILFLYGNDPACHYLTNIALSVVFLFFSIYNPMTKGTNSVPSMPHSNPKNNNTKHFYKDCLKLKNKEPDKSLIYLGYFCMVFGGIAILLGLYFISLPDIYHFSGGTMYGTHGFGRMLLIGGAIFFLSGILLALRIKLIPQKDRIINTKQFYKDCLKENITKCSSEKEIQKATLIAEKYNLHFSNISDLYNKAKEMVESDDMEENRKRLTAVKDEERAKYNQLIRYNGYSGRQKRVAMLYDEMNDANAMSKTLLDGVTALVGASQQKEKDWATLGGVASGIAGGAAGVATALDVQSQNAAIRAQNARNMEALAPLVSASASSSHKYKEVAESLAKEIENAKCKLVSKDSPEKCMKYLSFSDIEISVSETGTCTVTTNVSINNPVIIFDDVTAVIDGTIIATIYDGDKSIGSAEMVFPKYGVKKSEKLTGMCLYCGEVGKEYTVKFSPKNIWAMEQ